MSGSSDGSSDLRCDLEKLFLMFCCFSAPVRLQLDTNTLVFPRNTARFNDVEILGRCLAGAKGAGPLTQVTPLFFRSSRIDQ